MHSVITIFEFGYLSSKGSDSQCVPVDHATFDYLETLALTQSDASTNFLRLCSRGGHKAIQVRSYVGVIRSPSGVQIEVLPKIAKAGATITESRAALLNMLQHLRGFRHLENTTASVDMRAMPLLEVFIWQFLQSVNRLVKRGLHSEYVQEQSNESFMKGKLLIAKQLRHNFINQHRFYLAYDKYLQDRPVNRLINTALHKIAGVTRVNASQKLCRELRFAFGDIPKSRDIQCDFAKMRVDRNMNHYHAPLAWTQLILNNLSPLSLHGQHEAVSLLFPMEAVFEAYVASVLRQQLPPPYWLREQASQYSLVRYDDHDWFRLKPDLLVMQGKVPLLVLDTKWKLLDSSKANSTQKFDLSQADLYQMFAYGQRYLNGEGEMVLIYPRTAQFTQPAPHSFDFSSQLKLWLVPFDIADNVPDNQRLIIPPQIRTFLTEKDAETAWGY